MADQEEISVAEAARIKGVSAQAIRAALREGRLRGRRVGRIWLLRPADLETYQPQGHRPKKRPDSVR